MSTHGFPALVGFPPVAKTTFAFEARDLSGQVRVAYGVNSNPRRWGYHLLGLDFDIEVARGFPVIEARVEYPAEGYAAYLGWIQIVRYWIGDDAEPTVVVDVAPQMKESRMPYLSFGIQPVLFDAPTFTEQNVTWRAWSFLTFTPDCVMTSVVEPACGFHWGYDIRAGTPLPINLVPVGRAEWLDVREELRKRFPDWTFQGDDWEQPSMPAQVLPV
jgi:hypothetical protein